MPRGDECEITGRLIEGEPRPDEEIAATETGAVNLDCYDGEPAAISAALPLKVARPFRLPPILDLSPLFRTLIDTQWPEDRRAN